MNLYNQNKELRGALLHASLLAYPDRTKNELIDEINRLFPELPEPPQKKYVYGPEDVLTGDFGLFL